jgi:hypothetical protein
MMNFSDLSSNRYVVYEEIRNMLGFSKAEWKSLLTALCKTDNGWLEFKQGDISIHIDKFVGQDELRMEIVHKKDKVLKSMTHIFNSKEFRLRNTRALDC